jgi:hypothetical protein
MTTKTEHGMMTAKQLREMLQGVPDDYPVLINLDQWTSITAEIVGHTVNDVEGAEEICLLCAPLADTLRHRQHDTVGEDLWPMFYDEEGHVKTELLNATAAELKDAWRDVLWGDDE